MSKAKLFVLPFALLAAGLLMLSGHAHAAADTCIWTGGGGDHKFSTAANWSTCDNGHTLEAGDTLEFPANIASRAPVNDMTAGTSFAGINFTGNAETPDCTAHDDDYTLTGASIVLTGNIVNSMTGTCSASQQIDLDISGVMDLSFDPGSNFYNSLFIGQTGGTPNNFDFTGHTLTMGHISGGSMSFNGSLLATNIVGHQAVFDGDLSGVTGTLTINEYGNVNTDKLPVGGIVVATGANINFSLSGGNHTISVPLTLNGQSSGTSDTFNTYLNGTGASKNDILTFTGTLTLGKDIYFGLSSVVKFTGTINGAFAMHADDGRTGGLVLEAATNNSTTPNGTYASALKTTTYSTDVSGSSGSFVGLAENNELIVDTGGKVGTVSLSGGTLKGVGTTGDISMSSGLIAPGQSPGCLSSGNLSYTGGTLQIQIAGTTVCTQYDQQTITGTVHLGSGTTLDVSHLNGFLPAVGNKFTIIDNDLADPVTGTFVGLAEGGTFVVDGVTYSISYVGGDGNDVVLTATAVPVPPAVPAVPNTGIRKITAPVFAIILLAISAFGLVFVTRRLNKSKI